MGLLLLVLYLPSAYPATRFLKHIHIDYLNLVQTWDAQPASQVLMRFQRWYSHAAELSPIPKSSALTISSPINHAVTAEMAGVSQRLFNSPYFQSLDALLALAVFRLSAFCEWLPYVALPCFAILADGYLRRLACAKEFAFRNPEYFGAMICLTIILICGFVFGLVLPIYLPALLFPILALCVGVVLGQAFAHYHHHG